MKSTNLLSALLISTLFFGCSPKHPEEKPQGVLTDAQKKTLDKAKKTGEVLDNANKDRMKEADDAEK